MQHDNSASYSSASDADYQTKKAPYQSPATSSSARPKTYQFPATSSSAWPERDSVLKDIIQLKDDVTENEPPKRKEVVSYLTKAIPDCSIDDTNLHVEMFTIDGFYSVESVKKKMGIGDLSFMKKCHAHEFWRFLKHEKDDVQVKPADTKPRATCSAT
jgi:hypothetical protein